MSNIFRSNVLEVDYQNFEIKLFETNAIKYEITTQLRPIVKKYHRLTYVVALINIKLEQNYNENNKYLFVNEILSDLLTNISLSFIGFHYASQILIRRLIENFFNHIFYFEHPVEYELLNLGRNDYNPMIDLKNYFETHPLVSALSDDNIKIFSDKLFEHYQDLCRIVHTKGEEFMGLAKNLEEIKPEVNLTNQLSNINNSLNAIVYMLFKFHHTLEYTNVEKDIVVKSFARNFRSSLLA